MEPILSTAISSLVVILTDWVLSTDNALVIMMVVAQLPQSVRLRALRMGILLAVVQRLFFMGILAEISSLPFVKSISAILLLYMALHLLQGVNEQEEVEPLSPSRETGTTSVMAAVGRILIADLAMSLDNMVALSSLADGRVGILLVSLTLSMSTLFFLSQYLIPLVERFRVVSYLGSGMLAWTAGKLLAQDRLATEIANRVHVPNLMWIVLAVTLLYTVWRRTGLRVR